MGVGRVKPRSQYLRPDAGDVTAISRGLVRSGGIDWRVDVPNSVDTRFHGINDHGDVVGMTYLETGYRGVFLREGEVTILDGPQGTQGRQTHLRDISNNGTIVGYTRRDPGDGYTIGIVGTPKPPKSVAKR
jgi:hypothetical protein